MHKLAKRESLSNFLDVPLHASSTICTAVRSARVSRAADRGGYSDGVLHKHRTLDEQLDGARPPRLKSLSDPIAP